MPTLSISHLTHYRYRQPVAFGEHRILVRPRESYDQRLLSAKLDIEPEPRSLRWLQDVFGNAVAIASFADRATDLRVQSDVRVEHLPTEPGDIAVEDYARRYPFTYSSEDMPDLLRSIERQFRDPNREVDDWAQRFVDTGGRTGTLAMLTEMTAAFRREFDYRRRAEKGVQSPVQTLRSRSGSCRDYAVLMMEAARALGLAARFVSGYVYTPSSGERTVGGGNTHGWVRVFLPGSGWIEFDPTNGIVGNAGLVRVAVARDPAQAVPLSGTWTGPPGSEIDMRVEVHIERRDDPGTHLETRLKESAPC